MATHGVKTWQLKEHDVKAWTLPWGISAGEASSGDVDLGRFRVLG